MKASFKIIIVISCFATVTFACNILENGPTDLTIINEDLTPAVSPDGNLIAYYHQGNPNLKNDSSGLYIIRADGSGKRLLLSCEYLLNPDWSPDGKWIVYTSGIINLQGDSIRTFQGSDNMVLGFPDWSPDGKSILFNASGPNGGFYICDPFFKNIRLHFSEQQISGYNPRWSPDGKKFVYVKILQDRAGGEIFTVDTSGVNDLRLTDNNIDDQNPQWSPDGSMIAWNSNEQIYIMNIDGKNQRKLDDGESPSWTPDSNYIIYSKGNGDNLHYRVLLWKININGSSKTQLTF